MKMMKLIDGRYVIPKKGDIIETFDGSKFTFIDMKIVRWTGKSKLDGKSYNIPLFRDRRKTMPYCKDIVGKDTELQEKTVKEVKMKLGDLFALSNRKETFMYTGDTFKRGGKPMIKAIDLATGNGWTIGLECALTKVDLKKIKGGVKA